MKTDEGHCWTEQEEPVKTPCHREDPRFLIYKPLIPCFFIYNIQAYKSVNTACGGPLVLLVCVRVCVCECACVSGSGHLGLHNLLGDSMLGKTLTRKQLITCSSLSDREWGNSGDIRGKEGGKMMQIQNSCILKKSNEKKC